MRKYIIFLLIVLLFGCATNNYQKFYKSNVDTMTLKAVELLKSGEEPQIFNSDNFDRDFKILLSKNYSAVGYSAFNGGYQGEDKIKEQARRIGASIVLTNAKYTHTLTTVSPLFLPNTTTTHHSGTVMSGGNLGIFDGTSTSHGTTVVPMTQQQMRYDQQALFFVKSTQKLTYGVIFSELPNKLKAELERNTGVLIYVVVENTPAFYANVLDGDILIKFNDVDIINKRHLEDVMGSYNSSRGKCIFKVIRNGKEKDITINLM